MKNKSFLFLLLFFFAFCKKDDKHFEDCCKGSYVWKPNDSTVVAFPNAFTPDGNGLNDLFMAIPLGSITFYSFLVKKDGRLISDYISGWNGQDGNDEAPTGKYDFEATWEDTGDSATHSMSGTVCLFRECFPSETDLSGCQFASMYNNGSFDTLMPRDVLPTCN